MTDTEIILFLFSIKGIGKQTILKLYREFVSFPAIYHASETDLRKVLKPKQFTAFLSFRQSVNPSSLLQSYQKKGINFYSILDELYPQRFLTIPDPPLGIFVRGHLPEENTLTASIIGARQNSYYGEKQTKLIAKMLVEHKIEIVSGMARGIDSISQRTALDFNGKTYAILGNGINICYPPENQFLFQQIPLHGALISEYLPDTPPCSNFFPVRNRLISGLGDVLIVMEAREKSGTLITVDMALEQGKEIFVLPGRIDDPLSIGCNRLISLGAHIILDPSGFVEELLPYRNQLLPPLETGEKALANLLSSHGYSQNFSTEPQNIHNFSSIQSKDSHPSTQSRNSLPSAQSCNSISSTQGRNSLSSAQSCNSLSSAQSCNSISSTQNNVPLSSITDNTLKPFEQLLLHILDYNPQSIDSIFQKLDSKLADSKEKFSFSDEKLSISQVMVSLMYLCQKGFAKQEDVGWFIKI